MLRCCCVRVARGVGAQVDDIQFKRVMGFIDQVPPRDQAAS